MATMIAARTATSTGNQSRRVPDIARQIAYVNPDENPLLAVVRASKSGSRTVSNSTFKWIEKDMLRPRYTQVNGAATTGETTVTVDDGEYVQVGDLIRVVPTGELLWISAVSGDQLTATRSFGDSSGTAAATIADNADLFILGNTSKEGAAVREPSSWEETYVSQFTQILRSPFGATGTEAVSENYTGRDRVRQAKEAAINHAVDIERHFLFSERAEDTSTTAGSPFRSMGGLEYFLTSNNKDASGTLTEPELEDWAEDIFQETGTSNTRLLLASPLVCSVLNQMAAGRLQTVPSDKTFGIAIKEWQTAHGTFLIAKHRLLINGAGGAGYGGYAFALDPSKIKYVNLRERDTKLLKDRQAPGDDKYVDEYLTECSIQIENPSAHGVLTGVTG